MYKIIVNLKLDPVLPDMVGVLYRSDIQSFHQSAILLVGISWKSMQFAEATDNYHMIISPYNKSF